MFARITIIILFILSLLSSSIFIFVSKQINETIKIKHYNVAKTLFLANIFGIIFVAAYLLYNIISHNYQYKYIWNYSSFELPFYLNLSTFFAGQEGSFLLWLLFFGLIGLFLINNKQISTNKPEVFFSLYSIFIAFLLLLIILKSPFEYVWESMDNIIIGYQPINGRGLNPILENIWMAIHPPILFLGYSLMAIPYILAVTALINRDYYKWIYIAKKWIILSNAILGLGIMLGAFWAYETLGWGGFWGWDPVENASLLPWLSSLALIHTIVVQERTKGLVKTNLLLAIISFILVIYATFLTRSGILANFSVHSFSKPIELIYIVLFVFFIITFLFGFIPFLYRLSEINKYCIHGFNIISREFIISIGVLLILFSLIIIFIGTSFPIITDLFTKNPSTVDITFYNKWNIPILILIFFINSISFYFNWNKGINKKLFFRIAIYSFISIIVPIYLYFNYEVDIIILLIIFISIFSLIFNTELIIKYKKIEKITSNISHIGITVFIFGVIASTSFSKNYVIELSMNKLRKIDNLTFTFTAIERIEQDLKDREKYKYNILVKNNMYSDYISPIIYWSEYNNKSFPFMEPGIESSFLYDYYISPKSVQNSISNLHVILEKNNLVTIKEKNINLSLIDYYMDKENIDYNKPIKLGLIIDVKTDNYGYVDTLFTEINGKNIFNNSTWKKIRNTNTWYSFADFKPNNNNLNDSKAVIAFSDEQHPKIEKVEMITIEFTKKPLMSFVWIGAGIIILSIFITVFNRSNKNCITNKKI